MVKQHLALHYQVSGSGAPLILLHGNGEDLSIFNELTESLNPYFTVYRIDSRNHGQSPHHQPISYPLMTDDLIHFINTLNLEKPYVLGFSDGGIVALMTAMKEPKLIEKMILCGVNYHYRGLDKTLRLAMKRQNQIKPDPLIELMLKAPKIKKSALRKCQTPALLIVGDKDVILPQHTLKLHRYLPQSKLLILKDETHDSYVVNQTTLLPHLIAYLKKS